MEFTVRPIGVVKSRRHLKFEAPNQPQSGPETNLIQLDPQYADALQDLEGFDTIWVVAWFHRNSRWRSRVLPPRGPAIRRGLFATRSPHRPNPISLTSTPLLKITGTTLEVGPLDLLDGTPVLDIKPYLRTVDCHPTASLGWVASLEAPPSQPFNVLLTPQAAADLEWLRAEWNIDVQTRAVEILSQDPSPHRTRRIITLQDGRRRLACGPWRLRFVVENQTVTIEDIDQAFSPEALASEDTPTADRPALRAFATRKSHLREH